MILLLTRKVEIHLEAVKSREQCVSYHSELSGNDGQDRDVDTIELVKTPPGTALTQPGEYLSNRLKTSKLASWNRLPKIQRDS